MVIHCLFGVFNCIYLYEGQILAKKVKNMTFERVNNFVYLGTLITSDNNISAEINYRITLANRSYFGLVNILIAKDINRKYKVII
jgi:hypothetical protein